MSNGRLDFREHLTWVASHLEMVIGRDPTYREVVAYLQGLDAVANVLAGLHPWLVVKAGGGSSIHWSAIVKFIALEVEPVHHSNDLPAGFQEKAVASNDLLISTLFGLVDEFLAFVEEVGLHEIYAAFRMRDPYLS